VKATVLHGAGDVRVETVPDAAILRPTDAVVRTTATCVCGSDLWGYRGIRPPAAPLRVGHEMIGVVEAIGDEVATVRPGDFVIVPFAMSDGTCVHCRNGITTSCEHHAYWGVPDEFGLDVDAAQGEASRIPWADGTLVATPGQPDTELIPHLLTLTDVMATGHHAAVSAGVATGRTVAVVGDGAVGLCGVLAAARLGAERIIAMSRHADRQQLAKDFGATDIVAERGDEGAAVVKELLGGIGADSVLECVGTRESMDQAMATVRPGGRIGFVGVPAGGPELSVSAMFSNNITVGGGVAPVRAYLPELLTEVLDGSLRPGAVFDLSVPLDEIAKGYDAMDERRSIKTIVVP
jgi:threonine dehydrogenase-like Zn-dependent dehydrogenase